MGAVELCERDSKNLSYGSLRSRKILDSCLAKGLFIRPLGRVLYLMPPYCSTPSEIEWAWDVIGESLELTRE